MNIALWIIASVMAAAFLASGAMKLLQPKDKLVASGAEFLDGFSPGSIKAIGTLEVLAGVGLVLPAALDIAPVLVPLAAVGLAVMVIGAIIAQLRHHQTQPMVANLILIALAGVVVWGRLGPESFTG
jgi:uncharacterized membrane protein YphA (DoxX/SURF4 family)